MEVSWFITKIRNRALDFGILRDRMAMKNPAGWRSCLLAKR